jgi:hypothetical protein
VKEELDMSQGSSTGKSSSQENDSAEKKTFQDQTRNNQENEFEAEQETANAMDTDSSQIPNESASSKE